FSFGALLYEMVTRRRAFQGDSTLSVLSSVLRSEPQPVESIAPQVPPALIDTIAQCLRKEPHKRLQTMNEVKARLEILNTQDSPSDPWHEIGSSPLSKVRLPRGPMDLKFSKAGYQGAVLLNTAAVVNLKLAKTEDVPEGMVYVPQTPAYNVPLQRLSQLDNIS